MGKPVRRKSGNGHPGHLPFQAGAMWPIGQNLVVLIQLLRAAREVR